MDSFRRPPPAAAAALLLPVILTVWAVSYGQVSTAPPETGRTGIPAIVLQMPLSDADKSYLGLTGNGSFSLPVIHAQVLIIEVFSLYCSLCHREADGCNRLYSAIEADPGLRGRIKVLGIGAGNNPAEAAAFKAKNRVAFPVFHDRTAAVMKQLGVSVTPSFVCCRIGPNGTLQHLFTVSGPLGSPAAFLRRVRACSGL